jgi:hypothetical protein
MKQVVNKSFRPTPQSGAAELHRYAALTVEISE